MGWWGVNVMEGDPPMDAEADIGDYLQSIRSEHGLGYVERYSDESDKLWDTLKLDGVASSVVSSIAADKLSDDEDRNIARQVLGEIIICNGFPMPDDVRQVIIDAARADEWASEDDERKAAMEDYITRVTNYNGTAVEPVNRGLFDKIMSR